MAITVVRGVIPKTDTSSSTAQNHATPSGASPNSIQSNPNNPVQQTTALQSAIVSQSALTGEAVVNQLRVTRQLASGERIESYPEAKEVAEKVADEVRDGGDDGVEVHAVSSSNAQHVL